MATVMHPGDALAADRASPPRPLAAALIPWWLSLAPAVAALIFGRPAFAVLCALGGIILSGAACAAIRVATGEEGAPAAAPGLGPDAPPS